MAKIQDKLPEYTCKIHKVKMNLIELTNGDVKTECPECMSPDKNKEPKKCPCGKEAHFLGVCSAECAGRYIDGPSRLEVSYTDLNNTKIVEAGNGGAGQKYASGYNGGAGNSFSQPKGEKEPMYEGHTKFVEETSERLTKVVNELSPQPKEDIREEFYREYDRWELHSRDNRTRREFAADFFLSRCIPKEELKEEIEKMKTGWYDAGEGLDVEFSAQEMKDEILSLISKHE